MLKLLSMVFPLFWMAFLIIVALIQNTLINFLTTLNQEQFSRQAQLMTTGLPSMRMGRMRVGGVLMHCQLLCLKILITRSLFVARMALLERGCAEVLAVGA